MIPKQAIENIVDGAIELSLKLDTIPGLTRLEKLLTMHAYWQGMGVSPFRHFLIVSGWDKFMAKIKRILKKKQDLSE